METTRMENLMETNWKSNGDSGYLCLGDECK